MAAANPHTIVVLKTGSAVLMPWVDKVPAILEAWYPGEEDGNAVAAILFGDVSPSGKLPLTFPKQLSDLPANTPEQYPGTNSITWETRADDAGALQQYAKTNYVVNYSEGIFVGYRHFDAENIEPLFPSSATDFLTPRFSYTNLTIRAHKKPAKNDLPEELHGHLFPKPWWMLISMFPTPATGPAKRSSSFTLVFRPRRMFRSRRRSWKHFAKIPSPARPDRPHPLSSWTARALACWDDDNYAWTILPGTYRIKVGTSSRNTPLEGSFNVSFNSPSLLKRLF